MRNSTFDSPMPTSLSERPVQIAVAVFSLIPLVGGGLFLYRAVERVGFAHELHGAIAGVAAAALLFAAAAALIRHAWRW